VSDEKIEKIIEAARWAPSGFNSELWEFVVVKDQVLRDQISGFINNAYKVIFSKTAPQKKDGVDPKNSLVMGWQKAPVFIIPFGDSRVRECSPVPAVKTDDEKWKSVFYSSMAIT
jgi:nitroreductase